MTFRRPAAADPEDFAPNSRPQQDFFRSTADEALFGGSAGPGKTTCLVQLALRYAENPRYRAIIFRREWAEIEKLLVEIRRDGYYEAAEGRLVGAEWRFKSGAIIHFSHMHEERDAYSHKGVEYQYIGYDELTEFTEEQYTFLISRLRSSHGIPSRMRAATNPGGPGEEWVMKRWAAWLDPHYPTPARPGEKRWFAPDRDGNVIEATRSTPFAMSRAYFPAKLHDNTNRDPQYETKLRNMDPIRRAQFLDGMWGVKASKGLLFKREWFTVVDQIPTDGQWVRVWDFGASIDGDPTVGALWCRTPEQRRLVVCDVVRMRASPGAVEAKMLAVAKADNSYGRRVPIVIPQDPGAAGVSNVEHLTKLLFGYDVRTVRPDHKKEIRARPASAQAERRLIDLVRSSRSAQRTDEMNFGDWNAEWLAEHEAFPTPGVHDDQCDTTSDAVEFLAALPLDMQDLDRFQNIVGSGTAYAPWQSSDDDSDMRGGGYQDGEL